MDNIKGNIGIFGGIFWPRNPYMEINLYKKIKESKEYEVKIILWEDDFRINDKRNKKTKINFNKLYYINNKNLIKIKNIDELSDLSYYFDVIIGNNMINDRMFMDHEKFFSYIKCPIVILDIMGYDILKHYFKNVDYIFTKGRIFKEWLIKQGFNKDNLFVTGSLLMDDYKFGKNLKITNNIGKNEFMKKYQLNTKNSILLFTTSNLRSSRKDMNSQNLNELDKFYKKYDNDFNFILLSYPNDYMFYELKKSLRRSEYSNLHPDYMTIKNRFPNFKIIQCQDGYNATKYANKIFNISAGGLSIETILFCKKKSYTMNFNDKPYYQHKLGYKPFVKFPDEISNIHLNNMEDMLTNKKVVTDCDIKSLNIFYDTNFATERIIKALNSIFSNDNLNQKKKKRFNKLDNDKKLEVIKKYCHKEEYLIKLEEISNNLF